MTIYHAAGRLPAITTGLLMSMSLSAHAGGAGSGVADAEVRNGRATAGIYCPAIDATVTQSLASQIDCDGGAAAQPAVANDRIENRRGFRFPFLPPSDPIREFDETIENELDDNPQQVAQNDPDPNAEPDNAAPDPQTNPQAGPAPADPAPADPAPADPAPADPAPADPGPANPGPADPDADPNPPMMGGGD